MSFGSAGRPAVAFLKKVSWLKSPGFSFFQSVQRYALPNLLHPIAAKYLRWVIDGLSFSWISICHTEFSQRLKSKWAIPINLIFFVKLYYYAHSPLTHRTEMNIYTIFLCCVTQIKNPINVYIRQRCTKYGIY